jgi:glutaredoxin
VEFHEVNIDEDPDAEEIVVQANRGRRTIPTLKVGERYFSRCGYKLAEELKIPLNK